MRSPPKDPFSGLLFIILPPAQVRENTKTSHHNYADNTQIQYILYTDITTCLWSHRSTE